MKRIFAIIIALLAFLPAVSCAKTDKTAFNVYMPDGATAISMAYMMKNVHEIDGKPVKYTVVPASLIAAKVLNNKPDMAIMPVNVAATIANYSLAAVTSHGNLYIMTGEDDVTLESLEGKTIAAFGNGQIPGLILSYILEQNGITATIDFKASGADVMGLLNSGDRAYGLLPEPAVSTIMANTSGRIKIGVDLQEEYRKITLSEGDEQAGFPQAGMLVKNDADKAIVNEFLSIAVQNKDFAVLNAADVPAIIAANMLEDTESEVKALTAETVSRCRAYVVTENLQQVITDYFNRLSINLPTFYSA